MFDLFKAIDTRVNQNPNSTQIIFGILRANLINRHEELLKGTEQIEDDTGKFTELQNGIESEEFFTHEGIAFCAATMNYHLIFKDIILEFATKEEIGREIERYSPRISDIEGLSIINSEGNSDFYATAMAMGFLAASYTKIEDYKLIANKSALKYLDTETFIKLHNRISTAQAPGFEGFIERLKLVFGNDNFFEVLKSQRDFVGKEFSTKSCPSLNLTKGIMQAFAMLLDDEEYLEILRSDLKYST